MLLAVNTRLSAEMSIQPLLVVVVAAVVVVPVVVAPQTSPGCLKTVQLDIPRPNFQTRQKTSSLKAHALHSEAPNTRLAAWGCAKSWNRILMAAMRMLAAILGVTTAVIGSCCSPRQQSVALNGTQLSG